MDSDTDKHLVLLAHSYYISIAKSSGEKKNWQENLIKLSEILFLLKQNIQKKKLLK